MVEPGGGFDWVFFRPLAHGVRELPAERAVGVLELVGKAGEREFGVFARERPDEHLRQYVLLFVRQVECGDFIQRGDDFLSIHRHEAFLESHHGAHVAHAAAALHFRKLGGGVFPIDGLLVFRLAW